MTQPLPFTTSKTVVLDANGNGRIQLGPLLGQRWLLNIASIHVDSNTNEPTCKVYIGGTDDPSTFIDGTYTGSLNSTDAVAQFPITVGNYIIAVWNGGDVGANAQLTIWGTQTT